MIPDSQDHLAEVQHQIHQGVGQEQGLPQGVNFWKNCINEGYSGFACILFFVEDQRHQGVGQEQGHAQGLIFWESCINRGC